MRETALAVLFGLFIVCFLAIVIEESFFGGKRRRKLQAMRKQMPQQEKEL